MRTPIRLAAALCLVLALAAGAASAGPDTLHSRLAGTFRVQGVVPAESTAVVVALPSGRIVFSRNADVALEPASNEKLGRHLRGPRRARRLVPLPDGGAGRGPPRRQHLARPPDPEGLRRPGADLLRPEAARGDPVAHGHPARDRRHRRRRVGLRLDAGGATGGSRPSPATSPRPSPPSSSTAPRASSGSSPIRRSRPQPGSTACFAPGGSPPAARSRRPRVPTPCRSRRSTRSRSPRS